MSFPKITLILLIHTIIIIHNTRSRFLESLDTVSASFLATLLTWLHLQTQERASVRY
jgi:hypothetical protein